MNNTVGGKLIPVSSISFYYTMQLISLNLCFIEDLHSLNISSNKCIIYNICGNIDFLMNALLALNNSVVFTYIQLKIVLIISSVFEQHSSFLFTFVTGIRAFHWISLKYGNLQEHTYSHDYLQNVPQPVF